MAVQLNADQMIVSKRTSLFSFIYILGLLALGMLPMAAAKPGSSSSSSSGGGGGSSSSSRSRHAASKDFALSPRTKPDCTNSSNAANLHMDQNGRPWPGSLSTPGPSGLSHPFRHPEYTEKDGRGKTTGPTTPTGCSRKNAALARSSVRLSTSARLHEHLRKQKATLSTMPISGQRPFVTFIFG
ncbi:unnamed protein product [Notodromas monacha]|uniref:Uncharacterized protein n=1 Tax=Notodromas monacha TaxID=399045 RepID=A0A7R9BS91_9CRUS|nr:unnamed protein product [Notodromas monacha]CAG0919258.1 unnamed protein product [Notodromas monacha]